MNIYIVYAFLFAVGSILGWILEFFYRNLISHNGPRGKIFINPGFCRGPWVPIYGIGLCVMFTISFYINWMFPHISKLLVIGIIAIAMTIIEFIGGFFLLKALNMRLWDYSKEWGNVMGIICPAFSVIWGLIGAIYFLFIHPFALDGLVWLSHNLAFSFVIGLFFGFFIVDVVISIGDALIIKTFAKDHEVVVLYDELKELVQNRLREKQMQNKFFNQTSSTYYDLKEALLEHLSQFDKK